MADNSQGWLKRTPGCGYWKDDIFYPVGTTLEQEREAVLCDWGGCECGAIERLAEYRPLHQSIGALVDEVLGQVKESDTLLLERLQSQWAEVVGATNATLCTPLSFQDGRLQIEFKDSTCLFLFRTSMAKMLQEQVRKCVGDEVKTIDYVVKGKRGGASSGWARR